MRTRWTGLLVVLILSSSAMAQFDATAETLLINGSEAFTWTRDRTTVIQLQGPVVIDLDKAHMTSRQAVIWITPIRKSVTNAQRVEIVLVGDASVVRPSATHAAHRLYVEARVRGSIRLTAPKRNVVDRSNTELYKEADAMRPKVLHPGEPSGKWLIEDQPIAPTTAPAPTHVEFKPLRPVDITAESLDVQKTPEGTIAAVFPGKITLLGRMENDDYIELMADRAVVFTPYTSLTAVRPAEQIKEIGQAVTGVYLEGDVRILQTPKDATMPEQRMTAERAFYDFTTDRAVLTDVVLHTMDPKSPVPVIVRARMVRQLSEHEYTAEKGQITTSSFHTPSLSVGASKIYIHQTDIDDPVTGTRTNFVADDATMRMYGIPFFYSPVLAGSITERGTLRQIQTGGETAFGFGVRTQWGLFETLRRLPPKGTDATYNVDYFADRGPAFGLDGHYLGGVADEATLENWSYAGEFRSYIVPSDQGKDNLGSGRTDVEPESDVRGRVWWRHQHFLPNDWQVQLTAGYISDPTFLEEWFRREFRTSESRQTSLYLKHQKDSEAYTLLVSGQPNNFATVAETYEEQAEVQRYPELSYQRVGDSILDDHATFFSANTLSALNFKNSDYTLEELGFSPASNFGASENPLGPTAPGIPSYGQTGTPEDTTFRGDFRQEVDFPFSVYQFRFVPYVVGRYTEYSQSVDGSNKERLMAAAGMRINTAFWKVDDTAESRLFDLHRLRHVIEPELNLYTSVQNVGPDELLIYDEQIDNVADISAVQLGLTQRWQTKRGGPGQWRSVDVFTWSIQGNFFFNQPSERELNPADFRGLYFVSMPEASVPRNSINQQLEWKISDTVSLLSDLYYNLDENTLAATTVGASFRHDPRLSYYLGWRHIGLDLDEHLNVNGEPSTFIFQSEDLLIFATDYQLTSKYRLQLSEGYDVAQSRNAATILSLIRHFDRFYVSISFRVDEWQDEQAVFFNIWPEGMRPGTTVGTFGGPGGAGALNPGGY